MNFSDFIKKFDKSYTNDELISRFQIYKQNLDTITAHNSQDHSWKMGVNQFTDLSPEEFKAYKTKIKPAKKEPRIILNSVYLRSLPDEVDWVAQGAVTPVKDQGQCGSCWAFSTTGSIEGAYFLKNQELVSLSEQQLVDCSSSYGNEGCNGGLMDSAFSYVKDNGICSESDYGYIGADEQCNTECKTVTKVSSFVDVKPNDENSLKQAVSKQPVSVAIEADQLVFQFYQTGVMDAVTCGSNLDHGVLVVGYGVLDGKEYWKVKNSWGENWGQNGYILIGRNIKKQPNSGLCGILSEPSYPVV